MSEKQGRATQGVLVLCRKLGAEFTLTELVDRVVQENPDRIHEFADAWRELVRRRRVQQVGQSSTPRFRVARTRSKKESSEDEKREKKP
jgi:hypothetical protein